MISEMTVQQKAAANLLALSTNPYPGRGLIAGLSEDGKSLVQVYWIMGRSENSRNRVFVVDDCVLKTAPADPSKVQDASLIIYQAMDENDGLYVVSNGDQTDNVMQNDVLSKGFFETLLAREYEPGKPNFTPRITSIFSTRKEKPYLEIAVLKKSQFGPGCDRFLYHYDSFTPGIGHCVTTYSGDGNPLPSFCGEPFILPLYGDKIGIFHYIWSNLNEENRVSLAVKMIPLEKDGQSEIVIMNKYEAVV